MADDYNFDIPETGDKGQEAVDREKGRKSKSRQFKLVSPTQRARAGRTRVRLVIDPNAELNDRGIPQGNPAAVVRDVPALPSRMSDVVPSSGVVSDTENVFFNADHVAGNHAETPDLENCAACQRSARKTAKNSAIFGHAGNEAKYRAHPEHVREHIDSMMQKGVSLKNALEYVKKNHFLFGLDEEDEESGAGTAGAGKVLGPTRPRHLRRSKHIDYAEQFLIEKGARTKGFEPWEITAHQGKTAQQIIFEAMPELKEQIYKTPPSTTVTFLPMEGVELKPLEMYHTRSDGTKVPYSPADYVDHHTAEHKKAVAMGDTRGARFHQDQIRKHQNQAPIYATVTPDPNGKVWKKGIISRDDAWASLAKAEETGNPECDLKCDLGTQHAQCPKHGQLLFPEE